MAMKFYMTPGSCSTGIHILLEEAGLVFEAYLVNLLAGDQFKPEYLAINPNGSVPTLVREDGTTLTTFQSIAFWLARQYPRRKLLPADSKKVEAVMEMMEFAVNTLHGEGFTRIFTTERYTRNDGEKNAVRAQGLSVIEKGFAEVDKLLAGKDYVSDHFTIADAALFYVEFWAMRTGIELPGNCLAHYRRMLTRPAVRQVLMEEGYHSALH